MEKFPLWSLIRDESKNNTKYSFLDAETCNLGLNEIINLPWQISIIDYVKFGERKEYNFYIKWPFKIKVSKGAAAITGYNEQIIEQKGVSPEEVFEQLNCSINNCDILAGHNILGFDYYIISGFYRKMGKQIPKIINKILDTLCVAKSIRAEIPYNKKENFISWEYRMLHKRIKNSKCSLNALGKEYDIQFDENRLHDAIYDLDLNIKVWDKMKWKLNL